MTPTKDEHEQWLEHIDQAWEDYQKSVQELRDLLDETGEVEWDRTEQFAGRVEDTRMSVANIAVRTDENWNEACIDRAHELCVELNGCKMDVGQILSRHRSEESPEL